MNKTDQVHLAAQLAEGTDSNHTPMVVAAARALCHQHADACNVDEADLWNLESEWFKTDAAKALDACGAPELLEALKKTADMLGSACHFVPKNGGLMQMLAVVDVARAAIAKAEGGAA